MRQQGGCRGQRSGKGCGPLLATVICVVLLVLTVATYDPESRHETSGYESRRESIGQSISDIVEHALGDMMK